MTIKKRYKHVTCIEGSKDLKAFFVDAEGKITSERVLFMDGVCHEVNECCIGAVWTPFVLINGQLTRANTINGYIGLSETGNPPPH